jgi:hypothetical protein
MYGEKAGAYRVLLGKPEERGHSESPGVDDRIILRWIFGSAMWRLGLDGYGVG